jgi:Tol biopolymer transport system component
MLRLKCIVISYLCAGCASETESVPKEGKATPDFIAFESTRTKRYPENTAFAELPDRGPLLDVFLTRPDGSDAILLSRDRAQSGSFFRGRCRWSPDRKWLAWPGETALFASDRSGNTQLVYQHEPLQHLSYDVLPPWGFAWGPVSDRLAVWKSTDTKTVIVGLDGAQRGQISLAQQGKVAGIDWSSADLVAQIVDEENGRFCIYYINMADKNQTPRKVVTREGCIRWISFSPSGQDLVFVGKSGKAWSLLGISIEGLELTEIVQNLSGDAGSPWYWVQSFGERLSNRPRWCPDGSRLVYGDRNHVYVVGKDGTGLRDLTPLGMRAEGPVWSPDGTRIAFHGAKSEDELLDIWTMDGDGNNLRQVTNEPFASDVYPEWAP